MELTSTLTSAAELITVSSSDEFEITLDVSSDEGFVTVDISSEYEMVGGPGLGLCGGDETKQALSCELQGY